MTVAAHDEKSWAFMAAATVAESGDDSGIFKVGVSGPSVEISFLGWPAGCHRTANYGVNFWRSGAPSYSAWAQSRLPALTWPL